MGPRPADSGTNVAAPSPIGEPRSTVEAGAEQRQAVGGDRGERGERRGRRRGRRGGSRHGGSGASREAALRESGGATAAPSAAHEGGSPEAAGTFANGMPEQRHEPAAAREAPAVPESREAREAREPRDMPARQEERAAPLAHFEPTPPTESNTPRETKPYVVWSSTPSDHAVTGGSRGPEE